MNEHVYCVVIAFKMTEWVEQRIHIKFCIKPEHSSTETIQMIQKAFKGITRVQRKYTCGTNASSKTVESDPCSGRPATHRTPIQATIDKDQ